MYDNDGAQLEPIAIAAQNNMMMFVYDCVENNTITDGGVAPQCTFARPTYTHIEHIVTREYKAKRYLEHKDGRMVGRMKRRPNQGGPSVI